MAKSKVDLGVINANEAYSKRELMLRLGISQKFWDTMLDEGLRFVTIGHSRWVTGKAIIEYMQQKAQTKDNEDGPAV